MEKTILIEKISDRISKEYKKHKNIEGWEDIAAKKIFYSYTRQLGYFGFKTFAIRETVLKHCVGILSLLLGNFLWEFDHGNVYNWISLYILGYFICSITFDLIKIAVISWVNKPE